MKKSVLLVLLFLGISVWVRAQMRECVEESSKKYRVEICQVLSFNRSEDKLDELWGSGKRGEDVDLAKLWGSGMVAKNGMAEELEQEIVNGQRNGMVNGQKEGSFQCGNEVKKEGGLKDENNVMGLKECMEFAVSNSTSMRIAQADVRDAQVERRNAILNAFTPEVAGSSYAYYNFGRSIDPETNTYQSVTSFQNGYSLGAGITLFNGFNAVNNLKISRTAMAMGIDREAQTRDEICLATMEAYYNVVYFNEMVKAYQKQVETARESVKKAKVQERMGQKGYADVVQIEADLADFEYSLINCRNMFNDALLTLKDVMFWPVDEELAIDFSMISEETLLNEMRMITGIAVADNQESVTTNALATLPQVAIAKGEMDNAKRALQSAKWQLLPSLQLQGGWSTSYFTYPGKSDYTPVPFRSQFSNNGGEYIQLSMSIPIFNRLSRQSNISKRRTALTRATAEYERQVHQVEAEVKRALQDKEGAGAAYIQSYKRAVVQYEAYKYNTKKFEQGLISPIEYQTASNNWVKAKAERLNSILKYYLKRSVVEYYNGVPYLEQ